MKARTVEYYMGLINKKYLFEKDQLEEMEFLLGEFVKFMTHEEVKEILLDYHIEL